MKFLILFENFQQPPELDYFNYNKDEVYKIIAWYWDQAFQLIGRGKFLNEREDEYGIDYKVYRHPDYPAGEIFWAYKDDIIVTKVNGTENSINDFPATLHKNSAIFWLRNNQRHREHGHPQYIGEHQITWCIKNKLHREDGPAIITKNNSKFWYLNDHRLEDDEIEKLKLRNRIKETDPDLEQSFGNIGFFENFDRK